MLSRETTNRITAYARQLHKTKLTDWWCPICRALVCYNQSIRHLLLSPQLNSTLLCSVSFDIFCLLDQCRLSLKNSSVRIKSNTPAFYGQVCFDLWKILTVSKRKSKVTCRSGNFGISANISAKAAPFALNAKYSTALCCISTSMQLSYLCKSIIKSQKICQKKIKRVTRRLVNTSSLMEYSPDLIL